jgi:hypothetical protein
MRLSHRVVFGFGVSNYDVGVLQRVEMVAGSGMPDHGDTWLDLSPYPTGGKAHGLRGCRGTFEVRCCGDKVLWRKRKGDKVGKWKCLFWIFWMFRERNSWRIERECVCVYYWQKGKKRGKELENLFGNFLPCDLTLIHEACIFC